MFTDLQNRGTLRKAFRCSGHSVPDEALERTASNERFHVHGLLGVGLGPMALNDRDFSLINGNNFGLLALSSKHCLSGYNDFVSSCGPVRFHASRELLRHHLNSAVRSSSF